MTLYEKSVSVLCVNAAEGMLLHGILFTRLVTCLLEALKLSIVCDTSGWLLGCGLPRLKKGIVSNPELTTVLNSMLTNHY